MNTTTTLVGVRQSSRHLFLIVNLKIYFNKQGCWNRNALLWRNRSLYCIRLSKQFYHERIRIRSFVRCTQVNKSRVSVLEQRKIWFRQENKRRMHGWGRTLMNLLSRSCAATWRDNYLRGCPCKKRPLDIWPKTEFLQIFRVRQLVHVINKNGNNLAFNAIFQYFWRQFQRTVQNRLNRSVSSQI